MKRHGYLFERIVSFDNLLLAAHKARRGKQERRSVAHFLFHLESELLTLQDELQSGVYRMQPYQSFVIYEPKRRQICAAHFRDRVVHHAICHVLDPIFEARLIFDTYACRCGKGVHAAVQRALSFTRRFPYVLTGDVRTYFESVDHGALKTLLRRHLKDKALLSILAQIIDHPIPGGLPGKGLPIGNLTSQYFANFYLGELDHLVKERLGIKGYVRYMDDFLVFAETKPHLHETLAAIDSFLREILQLNLKEEAVQIKPVTQGIGFLGFRIFPQVVKLERRKWARFRRMVGKRERQYHTGVIDEDTLAQSVSSMVGHVVHADTRSARRQFFANSSQLGW